MLDIVYPDAELVVSHHERSEDALGIGHVHRKLRVEVTAQLTISAGGDHVQQILDIEIPRVDALLHHSLPGLETGDQQFEIRGIGTITPQDAPIIVGRVGKGKIPVLLPVNILRNFIEAVSHPMITVLGVILSDEVIYTSTFRRYGIDISCSFLYSICDNFTFLVHYFL